ncbi:MAG TPA: DUF6683 family protein [Kofleriaceae bacterium]|nr:DUF6683 family protein [Kofleriaceae bacterium]
MKRYLVFSIVAGMLLVRPALADVSWGISEPTLDQLSFDATNQLMIDQVMQRATTTRPRTPAKSPTGDLRALPGRGGPIAPKLLAASYPDAARAQAERVFATLLEQYHAVETQLGIEKFDLAGALAAFIAGNYMAARDVDVSDRAFGALVTQLRGSLATAPQFRDLPAQRRQEVYERLAILGMHVVATRMALQQRPDPKLREALQRAARGYLQELARLDADRMTIDERGLVVAP